MPLMATRWPCAFQKPPQIGSRSVVTCQIKHQYRILPVGLYVGPSMDRSPFDPRGWWQRILLFPYAHIADAAAWLCGPPPAHQLRHCLLPPRGSIHGQVWSKTVVVRRRTDTFPPLRPSPSDAPTPLARLQRPCHSRRCRPRPPPWPSFRPCECTPVIRGERCVLYSCC